MKERRLAFYQGLNAWSLKRCRKLLPNQKNFKRPNPKVSIHALIRYAERIEGYDVNALADKILNDPVNEKLDKYGGTGKFTVDGVMYIANDGMIVTVAKAEGLKKHLVYAPTAKKDGVRRWSF